MPLFTIHYYHHLEQDPEVIRLLKILYSKDDLILKRLETIMAAIDDLKTAIAALIAEGTSDIAALVTQINSQTNQDPAIVALTGQVTDAVQAMHQAFTGVTGTPVPTTAAEPTTGNAPST